jgi:hypothetical protein
LVYICLTLTIYTKTQDEEGKESGKTVDMMIAKDKERVPLHQPFTMEGAYKCTHSDS